MLSVSAQVASGIGTGLAPGTGYGAARNEASFAVGLKHVSEESIKEVSQHARCFNLPTLSRQHVLFYRRAGLPCDLTLSALLLTLSSVQAVCYLLLSLARAD